MIDIGIDWEARYGAGWIKRFSAAPAFEAGSGLLRGAALLWKGRYGQGRVVGKAAHELAGRMWDLGEHWRGAGLGWTATLLQEYGLSPDAAYLLGKFRDRRRYRPAGIPAKHPNAARRLAEAALDMASERLETIRESDRLLSATAKDAELWEDRLEALGETPLGVPPEAPFITAERFAIDDWARFRTCEGLAYSAASVFSSRSASMGKDGPDPQAAPWYAFAEQLGTRAKKAYATFAGVDGHGPFEEGWTEALLAARDDAGPYAEFWERHHEGEAAVRGAVAVAALYLAILLQGDMDIGTERLVRNALKQARLDLPRARQLRALPAAE